MVYSLIVAASEDNAIGKDGHLMWRIQNDMRFFKNTTWGFPVIMGRKTYDELGKALEGRSNFVVSRNPNWKASDARVFTALEDAMEAAGQMQTKEVFIVGGAEIYSLSIPYARRIYLTRVHAVFPEADTWFPSEKVNWNEWHCIRSQRFEADEKNEYAHTIECWERKGTD
jgi:dihydrofolate reductase